MNSSCYKCEERKSNCHQDCEKYAEYCEKMKKKRDYLRKNVEMNNYYADITLTRYSKQSSTTTHRRK